MALHGRVTFGLAVFGVAMFGAIVACSDRDVTRPTSSIPVNEPDASMPPVDPDRDAGTVPVTPDAATAVPEAGSTCAPLSTRCPFLDCEDRASTLAAASSRCNSPPFISSVTQGSACGRTFVAYRYGASDTAIAFFDPATGALTGRWNQSDTGEITCAGDIDLTCASSTESSLPFSGGCLSDAGTTPQDASAPDSGP
jgi:hypothetical protein